MSYRQKMVAIVLTALICTNVFCPVVYAKKAPKVIPAEASNAAGKAWNYLWSADFRMAEDNYTQAISFAPEVGEYWLYRGVAKLMAKEDHTRAVEDFDKALSCKMSFGEKKICKMARKVALGDKKGFIRDMNFLDIFLPGKYIYPIRGVGRGIMGDWKAALDDCNKVINTKDAFEGVYFGRAFSKYNLSDMLGAIENFDQAIRVWPDYVIASSYRGLAKLNLGDLTGAKADFDTAISKQPDSAFAFWGRGRTKAASGNLAEAEKDFTQAILFDKRAADAYSQRGLVRYAEGNLNGAKSDFEKALSIAPYNGYVLRDFAKYKVLQGDLPAATDSCQKALLWFREFGEPYEEQQTQTAFQNVSTATRVASVSLLGNPPMAAAAAAANMATAASRPIGDKWALVVGIGKFQDPTIHPLSYADKDAVDFYKYLITEAGFKPDHVHLLLNEQATERRILHEVGDDFLVKAAGPNDLVVLYFSTHGSAADMDAQGNSYLIAHDSERKGLWGSSIEMNKMSAEFKRRLQTNRMLIILDACHSGATDSGSKGLSRSANFDTEKIVQGCGKQVLCSSRPHEQSYLSKRYSNSVFTKHLLDGLRLQGRGTRLSTAFDNMASRVEEEVRRDRSEAQHPVHNLAGWMGDDIVIGAMPQQETKGYPQSDLKIPAEFH